MQGIIVMVFSLVFTLLLVNIEGTQVLPEPVSRKVDGRIVNGTIAEASQFPHMVSLRRKYSEIHFCGGSIITEKWIITAGHCMYNRDKVINPTTFRIIAGGVKLKDVVGSPIQKRDVENLFLHPEYDHEYLVNDAALLLLTKPLLFHTQYVQPIGLATLTPPAGTMCTVAGWGYLREDIEVSSNDLMFLELPLLPQLTCKKLLGEITKMTDGQICAGYVEGERDACKGDSGGPLTCNGVLTGLVSGGKGCALSDLPGFYTDVAYFKNWTDEVQRTAGSCCRCACERSSLSRSSASISSTSVMTAAIIYSLRSLHVAFY